MDNTNYLELTLSDGTVARWAFESKTKDVDKLTNTLEKLLGAPQTIKT